MSIEQVPKEVDKVAEESEIIKETIIDNERGIKDFPAVEEDESINKVSIALPQEYYFNQ